MFSGVFPSKNKNKFMSNQILISMPIDEFWKQIQDVIKKILVENIPEVSDEPKVEFLTRKEVAKLLKISLPTLGEYTKNGILIGYRLGNHVRYKRHEIDEAGKIINSIKYRKG